MSQAEKTEYPKIYFSFTDTTPARGKLTPIQRTKLHGDRKGLYPFNSNLFIIAPTGLTRRHRRSSIRNYLFFDPVTAILTTLPRITPEGVALRFIPLYYFMVC